MKAKSIIVTAGHSDQQSGAFSPDGKFSEAKICTELRDRVASLLRRRGFTVLTDGDAGRNLSLREAIKLARTHSGPEVELHLNSSQQPNSASGVECFGLTEHKPLAQALAQEVAAVLALPVRGERGFRHQRQSQHKTLGIVNAGALLLEVCFINNAQDMAALLSRFDAVARAIADVLQMWATGVESRPIAPAPVELPKPAPPVKPAPSRVTLPFPAAAQRAQELLKPTAPRRDSSKSLWAACVAKVYAVLLACWAHLEHVHPALIFGGLVVFGLVVFVLFQHRQTKLGALRESRN